MHSDDYSCPPRLDVPGGPPDAARDVTFLQKRTKLRMNCMRAEVVADRWTFCTIHGRKVTSSECLSCARWEPYDAEFPADSAVLISVYGLSPTERRMRENVTVQEVE